MKSLSHIFRRHTKKVISGVIITLCLGIYLLLSLIFDGFSASVVDTFKKWTGLSGNDIIVLDNVSFDVLEPAQKRNEYILVTGITVGELQSVLIALLNISTQSINLIPYNLEIIYDEKVTPLWKLDSAQVETYLRSYNLNIVQSFRFDKKILLEKVTAQDWVIFSLEDKSGKRVPIRTELRFNQLLKENLTEFETTENFYYSLLKDYIIPYDPQLEDLALQKLDWKPLYEQKDILSLSEKATLFQKKVATDKDSLVPFYLVDVRSQYFELLRLDKVTPFLTESYEKK